MQDAAAVPRPSECKVLGIDFILETFSDGFFCGAFQQHWVLHEHYAVNRNCEGLSEAFERIKTSTDGKREPVLHTVAVQSVGCRAAGHMI